MGRRPGNLPLPGGDCRWRRGALAAMMNLFLGILCTAELDEANISKAASIDEKTKNRSAGTGQAELIDVVSSLIAAPAMPHGETKLRQSKLRCVSSSYELSCMNKSFFHIAIERMNRCVD